MNEERKAAVESTVGSVVGRCRSCRHGELKPAYSQGKDRVCCEHPKVFGHLGMDDDGAEEFEAAELHFGPDFGCVHFAPNNRI